MDIIHRLIGNFALGIFILLFYEKTINTKPKNRSYLFGPAVMFATYMFFVHTYIQEPGRIMGGILILGISLWLWKRNINWAALVLAFSFGYCTWIVALYISAFLLNGLLDMEETVFYWGLALCMQASFYSLLYTAIRLKNGIPSIDELEIKGIIFSATGIVLAFWGAYHMTLQRLYESNRPLFRAAFAALIIVALAATFLIVLFSKRYRERIKAEKHCLALTKDNLELSSKHHGFRALVQSSSALCIKLIDRVKTMPGQHRITDMAEVLRYLELAKQCNIDINEKFALEDIIKEVQGFVVPEDWLLLKVAVVEAIKECERKEFAVFAHSTATTWEQIRVSKAKLVRLVQNLLSNALKELERTEIDEKALEIYFFDDDDGTFTIEVIDTAHEFHSQVLANLGRRGNSTNGTGNGYAEVFEFLVETGASLLIIEQMKAGNPKKTIRVAFDYQERILIRTSYRYVTLKEALIGTRLEVEPWLSENQSPIETHMEYDSISAKRFN